MAVVATSKLGALPTIVTRAPAATRARTAVVVRSASPVPLSSRTLMRAPGPGPGGDRPGGAHGRADALAVRDEPQLSAAVVAGHGEAGHGGGAAGHAPHEAAEGPGGLPGDRGLAAG